MTTRAYSLADAALRAVGEYLDQYQAERRLIQSHPDYSQTWKDRTAAQRRDMHAAAAKLEFRQQWQKYQKAKQAAAAAVIEARQAKDAGLNWSQIQVMATEYASRIKNPPPGKSRVDVLNALAEQASASREGRRAYAVAAGEYLTGGELAQQASRARHLVREWEQQDASPVVEAERQAAAFESIEPELRRRALDIEAGFTGKPAASVWAGISEWQRDVLAETPQSLGYVVMHDADEQAAYMGQPVPSQPRPSGIEE